MPKHIILFSDGTGNSSAKVFKTNVWRLYQAVDLADPQHPEQPRQFAFYDNGVGTSSFKPLAVLGGALGVGLSRNVRDLYMFLCRLWRPGDRIYVFGFSRGAFTIRVLVGLAMSQGLVPYRGDEAELDRLSAQAYRAYRRDGFKESVSPIVEPLRNLRDAWLRAWDRLLGRKPYRDIVRIATPQSEHPLEIDFLGLWDTVDAYGLPVDELTRAIDRFVWPLTMRDYNLSPRVRCARHALSLDDERNTFHPRLWNEEPDPEVADSGVPGGNRETRHVREERISQVWFAGVHSNVGGGYPDDALSYVPLEWIMREAAVAGLRYEPDFWTDLQALSDENGPLNDSRHGLAGYYRYNPRRIERLTDNVQVRVKRTKVHESVLRRIKVGHDGYAPIVLPPGFAVMRIDGEICEGNAYLAKLAGSGAETCVDAPSAPQQPDAVGPGSAYAVGREHVYNWVWWRRIAYFVTFGWTVALLAMPLFAPAAPDGACGSALCFTSGAIRLAGFVLPQFASTWVEAFASHPSAFWFLAAMVGFGLWIGGALEGRVRDEMRRVWYAIASLRPQRSAVTPPPRAPGRVLSFIEGLRQHKVYKDLLHFLTWQLLPIGFLLALFYVAVAFTSQLAFAGRASAGGICHGSKTAQDGAWPLGGKPFATRDLCTATGIWLEKGVTYRLLIAIPASAPWTDSRLPAGPGGIDAGHAPQWMAAAVPLRRHPGQPWFQAMARIGARGNDTYVLHAQPLAVLPRETPAERGRRWLQACAAPSASTAPPSIADGQVFAAEIVARTDGELFLYVNDAVFLPGMTDLFYRNNQGRAAVTASRVLPPCF